jgi:hypothetical protein
MLLNELQRERSRSKEETAKLTAQLDRQTARLKRLEQQADRVSALEERIEKLSAALPH